MITNNSVEISLIARQLKIRYRDFSHHNKNNPLDELLFILCSVKRSEQVYLRAFKSLKQAYPTYLQLNQAPVTELVRQISWGGLQNHKALALRNIMIKITEKFGKPTLAPLRRMSEAECEKFLCSLPGIGKKVARCVMMYSLKRNVFPVDTHCWRISKRLGLIKPRGKQKYCTSHEMDILQKVIPPKLRLSLHVNMISLGRDVCRATRPNCSSCVILEYCPQIIG